MHSDSIVENAVRGIGSIAALPEITLQVIRLVEDPGSTAQDLHFLIRHDPALSCRLLMVVNSAFYGTPRRVGSVEKAINMLGLNAVKNIAVAASLSRLFRAGELCHRFSARALWRHAVAVGCASRELALASNWGDEETAFLAGLLHDIGFLVELQSFRAKMIDVFERLHVTAGIPDTDLRVIECDVLGADHTAFGSVLCRNWRFPTAIEAAAAFHHDPFAVDDERRSIAAIVAIADRLAADQGIGFRLDLPETTITPALCDAAGVTVDQVADIRAELPAAWGAVQSVFNSTPVGTQPHAA